MARYIDKDELIKAIEESQRNTEHHKDGRGKQIHVSEHRHFIKMVYKQPTADVQEVRHGRWENQEGYDKCSVCEDFELVRTNFCPNCGATMDGKE